jgi:hypothetical protein
MIPMMSFALRMMNPHSFRYQSEDDCPVLRRCLPVNAALIFGERNNAPALPVLRQAHAPDETTKSARGREV